MADSMTPTKSLRLGHPLPNPLQITPLASETSTPSRTGSDTISPTPVSLPPVVLTSSNPISIRRYRNHGSFSQPLRPTLYPPAKVPEHTEPQAMGGGVLTREDSASSKQSRESSYSARSSLYTASARNALRQHEVAVADILSDIQQLEICNLGDTPLENLLSTSDLPEGATILHDFRQGVKSGDIKSPVCTPSVSSFIPSKPPPELPPRPRKLRRRPRKDSVKTPIHGGIISTPIEASMDVHPGEITRAVTVADGVLQCSPYKSLRSYSLSQPTVEEEEKFYVDLIAQINKNTIREGDPTTPTRDSYASMSSAGGSAASDGTPCDLTPEHLLAARKENAERYGW